MAPSKLSSSRFLAPFKPAYHAIRATARLWRVRRLVGKLRSTARSRDALMPLVAELRAAWGNDSYTADLGFLNEMVSRALESPGPYLDCGSGISTVILAAIAERTGDTVWSLEQDEQWCSEMRAHLTELRLDNVQLVFAPLSITDDAAWYSIDRTDFPPQFPLVLCDGPAVRRSLWPPEVFQSWRVGVVRGLRNRNVRFGTIVLDDADDRRCASLIESWRRDGLTVEIVETSTGRHVVAHNDAAIERSAIPGHTA